VTPFYRRLADFAQAGEPVATATVVAAHGSTPREVGARMIVRKDGAIVGSVGGGCGEAQVFWEAVRVLEEGRPRICEVDLTGDMNDLSPTNCGGVMEVFVDRCGWDCPAAVGLSDLEVVRHIGEAGAGLNTAPKTILTGKCRSSAITPKAVTRHSTASTA